MILYSDSKEAQILKKKKNMLPFHVLEIGVLDHAVHLAQICPELHFQSLIASFHLTTSQSVHYFQSTKQKIY